MARIAELHKKWMKEPKYRKAYEALEEEFVFASAVIEVRNRARLTQEELARKMGTTHPVVARLAPSNHIRAAHSETARVSECQGANPRPLRPGAPRPPIRTRNGFPARSTSRCSHGPEDCTSP